MNINNNALIVKKSANSVKNKTCQANIVTYLLNNMDCGNAVGIIYLDFSKTLDNVVPDILISEQFKYGLDYMTNRCKVGLKNILNSFINSSSTDLGRHGLWCYRFIPYIFGMKRCRECLSDLQMTQNWIRYLISLKTI